MPKTTVSRTPDGRWIAGEMIFDDEASALRYAADMPGGQTTKQAPPWLIGTVCILLIFVFGKACSPSPSGTRSQAAAAFNSDDAFWLCRQALRMAARDAEKADIPHVPDQRRGSSDESHFAWNNSTRLTRMRNGLGLEVGVAATCTVSKSQKRITSLTLDGKQLI